MSRASSQFAAYRKMYRRRKAMRLHCIWLSVLLASFFQCRCDAVSTTMVSKRTKLSELTSPERLLREHSPSAGHKEGPYKRHLRARGAENDSLLEYDEERISLIASIRKIAAAIKAKIQIKVWLFRGVSPESVREKLKVTTKEDPNYKRYSKYYFKFAAKYPNKMPTNLSASARENIMKARLNDWFQNQLTPPQVFKELNLKGSFESARGEPNYKYFEQYYKMWRDEQVRLSRQETENFLNNYVRHQ